MNTLFKNPEVKSILVKLLLLQLIFAAFAFLFIHMEMNSIKSLVVNQNYALAGRTLNVHPELENDIIQVFTREASPDEIEKGRQILLRYGYSNDLPVYSLPKFKGNYILFEIKSVSAVMLCIIPVLLLIISEYNRVFSKLNKLSAAAEAVVDGKYDINLPENSEGDFAKLGHNFNMMTRQLKLTLDKLHNDRLFLKNVISDISHQLKTPLSSMIVLNDLLLENKNIDDKLRDDFLAKIKSQLCRMEWLIANLLKVARLESGSIIFQKKPVLIMKCIEKAVENLAHKAEERGQAIEISGNAESAYFIGDEGWTAEAVTNIIKNSIEHTKPGGRIDINIDETPLLSSISIKDNGEGIDEKDLPRIFERFYQGSSGVKAESVGIGLSLTKLIVEGQGGSISVQSQKGFGAKFTINFLKGII